MLNRAQKIAKLDLRDGPGVFSYIGGAFDTESTPTVLRYGRNEPEFGADELPVVDRAGRQVFKRVGHIAVDESGKPRLGGPPTVKRIEMSTFKVGGVTFQRGEKIVVYDHKLALKLRVSEFFDEDEGAFEDISKAHGKGKAKRKLYRLKAEPLADAGKEEKPLDDMSKAELLLLAESKGIAADKSNSKDEIKEALLSLKAG